ncbi:MAG: N-6 DNA methylase, partial [Planctomycetaceae bacterium]|nr:N-6 DNA methylase [Planctomycetaceae bacterium]
MVTIEELIRKFRLQQDSYCRAEYNEAQLRREFLDDMIRLWGWDIGNTEVLPETFKEVVVEDKIQMNGRAKSPDYALQLVEKKLLFIEAKKPAINIKESKDSAFQVRSYAWTATHPLCVLTNFAEFAVYDTTIPPLPNDRADTSRIFYCTFEEYLAPCKSYPDFPTHWDFITGLFGKNAVLKGSLAQFRQPGKSKGTALVDEMFLRDIESWRTILAENIALRNKISERELNFAVQATIDRIVFLRICEGRGIEKHGRIEKAAKGKNVYNALFNLFYEADVRYDSGLFYFSTESGRSGQPDSVTPKLKIDDSPLKKIVAQLYFPAPYAFEEISADILGSVYERFLGKTIRLESKHQIKIEEKPEIRKAGGVYYTPVYIVDYIVDNTVGAFLKTQTPQTVKKLRILDPACGSGSFLIVA